MVAANPTSVSKSVPVSDLCVSVFGSPNLSPFNYKLLALSVVEGSTVGSLLTPFPATLASSLQITEKSATLSPVFATLTSRVKHKSCVCHSYKKHPGSHPPNQIFSFRSLVNRHSLLSPIPFKIRTCAKYSRNPFRMNTSKTQDLKLFRMNTYEKTGGGVP